MTYTARQTSPHAWSPYLWSGLKRSLLREDWTSFLLLLLLFAIAIVNVCMLYCAQWPTSGSLSIGCIPSSQGFDIMTKSHSFFLLFFLHATLLCYYCYDKLRNWKITVSSCYWDWNCYVALYERACMSGAVQISERSINWMYDFFYFCF